MSPDNSLLTFHRHNTPLITLSPKNFTIKTNKNKNPKHGLTSTKKVKAKKHRKVFSYRYSFSFHWVIYLKTIFTIFDSSLGCGYNFFVYLQINAAKSLPLCPTLCDPIDGSPPGSPVPGILQARTPEWVAISFSSAWKWKVKVKSLSRVRLLVTPWTAAHQAPWDFPGKSTGVGCHCLLRQINERPQILSVLKRFWSH